MTNNSAVLDRLEAHYHSIIQVMNARFTSHEFFQRLAYEQQVVTMLRGSPPLLKAESL